MCTPSFEQTLGPWKIKQQRNTEAAVSQQKRDNHHGRNLAHVFLFLVMKEMTGTWNRSHKIELKRQNSAPTGSWTQAHVYKLKRFRHWATAQFSTATFSHFCGHCFKINESCAIASNWNPAFLLSCASIYNHHYAWNLHKTICNCWIQDAFSSWFPVASSTCKILLAGKLQTLWQPVWLWLVSIQTIKNDGVTESSCCLSGNPTKYIKRTNWNCSDMMLIDHGICYDVGSDVSRPPGINKPSPDDNLQ